MKSFALIVSFISLFYMTDSLAQQKLNYPTTAKVQQTDDYFGTKVADPYRWLEVSDSAAVADWVKAQNQVTFDYLKKIPFRDKIRERLEKTWNYPKIGAPFKEGNFYYFYKNNGLQNQSVLYRQKTQQDEPEVFLDPNKLAKDGTVALSSSSFSADARYFAYSTAKGGSDWNEIQVMDVKTKKKLADHIRWVKFSGISWYKDGFFYSAYDAPKEGKELEAKNEYHKVYYHQIGIAQSEDVLVYENKEKPLRNHYVSVTEDERFLILYASEGTSGNEVYIKDLSQPDAPFQTLIEGFDTEPGIIDNIEGKLLLMTNHNAPKYKLVLIDPNNPKSENWQSIIPESQNVLQGVSYVGGKLIANYLKDAGTKIVVFDLAGKQLSEVQLPTIGTASGFGGKKADKEVFYTFTSFTYPTTIYKYDIEKNSSVLYNKSAVDFDMSAYETKQVFYKSKDGTKVPMFITHKKGLKLDGKNPTYLYAYGGFNISLTPSFSVTLLPFLEKGGVYVVANLRGGAEYGEAWHQGGMLLKKQNVFDDFIAAAEYLIKNKYTTSEKLAIAGGSNGGLLVGAVMNQRPELFKVAFPAVGVMDMLRFHKFTIGWAWVVEYGSSERNEAEFKNLYGYSPLHTIKKGAKYPATMVTTADHDDRVVPAHSFKYIATLQDKNPDNLLPLLIRIDEKAGHGAGKPTAKVIDEWADKWAFLFWNMGVSNY
jgi:prolyl oligopeptidase